MYTGLAELVNKANNEDEDGNCWVKPGTDVFQPFT